MQPYTGLKRRAATALNSRTLHLDGVHLNLAVLKTSDPKWIPRRGAENRKVFSIHTASIALWMRWIDSFVTKTSDSGPFCLLLQKLRGGSRDQQTPEPAHFNVSGFSPPVLGLVVAFTTASGNQATQQNHRGRDRADQFSVGKKRGDLYSTIWKIAAMEWNC
jgi:hypothetical protein